MIYSGSVNDYTGLVDITKKIYFMETNDTPLGFTTAVFQAIKNLSTKEVGRRLINKIDNGKHRVYIRYGLKTAAVVLNPKAASIRRLGASTLIHLHEKSSSVLNFNAEKIESVFFIELAHELIHAYRNSYGKRHKNSNYGTPLLWSDDSEFDTILGPPTIKGNRLKICENSIRFEHGLPLRFSHHAFPVSPDMKTFIQNAAKTYLILAIFQYMSKSNPQTLRHKSNVWGMIDLHSSSESNSDS